MQMKTVITNSSASTAASMGTLTPRHGTPSSPPLGAGMQAQQPGSLVLSQPRRSTVPLITRPDLAGSPRALAAMQAPPGFMGMAEPRRSIGPSQAPVTFVENGLSVTTAPLSPRSQGGSQPSTQATLCRTFDSAGREFQPLVVTSTPVELLNTKRGSIVMESTVGSSSIGVPLEDVSGITGSAEDHSNLGQVTFDAGGPDPIVFVKEDHWSTCKPVEVSRRVISTHTVQRQFSGPSSAPLLLSPEMEASGFGSISFPIRSVPSRQQSRSSRSPSPAASPPAPIGGQLWENIVVHTGDTAKDVLNGSSCNGVPAAEGLNVSASEGVSMLGVSMEEGQSSINASPERERSSSPQGSKWATAANFAAKQAWKPAISKPSLFSRMQERPRSASRTGSQTPPRSACSTPQRQRGVCCESLYNDAAERCKRRKARKEAKESDNEAQLRASRESSLRATRRYRSSDNRTVLQRSEDHLRRKADVQQMAVNRRQLKEEEELKECTFRPALQVRTIAARRAQDEREMERHLRQLAHKQLDVRARLVQLEREWCRVHRQRKALFSERCKVVQHDRKQEVFDLLNTKEGQEYYWDRVQRLSESGSAPTTMAQSRVLQELLQDQRSIIEQQVGDEVDTELQLNGRNLDFAARRNVLLESLEAIEARAQPTLRMLTEMPEGVAILKESGFNQGLATQMRDDVPDPNGSISRQNSAEKVAVGEIAVDVVTSPRVRNLTMQSPRGGSTVVPQGMAQVNTALTSQSTLIDTDQPPSRYAPSVASRGSLQASVALQPAGIMTPRTMTVRPSVASMPTRLVSATLPGSSTPSQPLLTPGYPSMTPGPPMPPGYPIMSPGPIIGAGRTVNMPIGTSQMATTPGTPASQVVRLHSHGSHGGHLSL